MKKIISVTICLMMLLSFTSVNYVEAKSLPKKLNMFYSSGAGAWSTGITVSKNGSFTGNFHDSDADVMYSSEFKGKFTKIKKAAANKYTMKLTTLKYTNKVETEKKDGYKIEHTHNAYGIKKGKTYTLYCPGFNASKLPKQVKEWTKILSYKYKKNGKLTKYIMYNKKEGVVFLYS